MRHQQQTPDPVPVGTLCSSRLLFGCATHPLPLGRSDRRLAHHCMRGPDKLAISSILPCVGSAMTFCSTCDCWQPMHAPTCWVVLCTACVGIQQQKRACTARWPQSHCRCRYLFTRLLLGQERGTEAAAHSIPQGACWIQVCRHQPVCTVGAAAGRFGTANGSHLLLSTVSACTECGGHSLDVRSLVHCLQMLALTAADCSQTCCADTLQPTRGEPASMAASRILGCLSQGQPRIGLAPRLVSLGQGLSALFASLLLFLLACWSVSSRAACWLPALGYY